MGSLIGCCRVRIASSMAGWSMVAEEGDAVIKSSKNVEVDKSAESLKELDLKIQELVSMFKPLLESFLSEFSSVKSFRPLPPMIGDGRVVDLVSLFVNVSHRGGFDAVSENRLWDLVARECGLGFEGKSASLKLIYVKYLDALERWLNRVVAGDTDVTSVELSGISDGLVGRVREFLYEVKRRYELRKGEAAKEFGEEMKWFVTKMKRVYDEFLHVGNEAGSEDVVNETEGSKESDEKVEVMRLEFGGAKEGALSGKRKRECSLETLKWLSGVAKDPCDPSFGRLPERSKWEFYGSDEPWRQLLLFRASRSNTDSNTEKSWQKLQKMHPSLYDDSAGPGYNLRERLTFDGSQSNEKKAGNGYSSDEEDRPCASVGSKYQAEIPEWTGIASDSDSKWLGTQIWPLSKEQQNATLLIERDPIGKGRQDHCGCQYPGSIECVKFHITTKAEKLKLELGSAFFSWSFDIMGEGDLKYWTDFEQKKVKALITNPPTLSPLLFDQLKKILASKSRASIVSYFYNVILMRFRAIQNRTIPYEIDSDTDTLYDLATADPEANAPQKSVLLSPQKKRG